MRRKVLLFLAVPVMMVGAAIWQDESAEAGLIFHRHRGGSACGCRVRLFAEASCCGTAVSCSGAAAYAPSCAGFLPPTGHFEYRKEPIDSSNQAAPTLAPPDVK